MHKRIAFALLLATFACSAAAPGLDSRDGDGELVAEEAVAPVVFATSAAPATARVEAARATATARAEARLVLHAGARAFILVDARSDASLAEGPPRLVETDREGVFAAERPIDLARLPDSTRALVGQRVSLLGEGGVVCEAIVGELSLLERVSPDGEDFARWSGTALADDGQPLPSPAQATVAQELWSMTEQRAGATLHPLVAALRPVTGASCEAATVAAPGDQSPSARGASDARGTRVRLAHATPASDALESRALTAFRALPEHLAIAADYRTSDLVQHTDDAANPGAAHATSVRLGGEQEGASGVARAAWDTHAEARPVVRQLDLGDEQLVWVSANVGEGCGDFSAQLAALFRVSPRGELTPVRTYAGVSGELHVLLAEAGRYQLFFPEAQVGADPDDELESHAPHTFGCGC